MAFAFLVIVAFVGIASSLVAGSGTCGSTSCTSSSIADGFAGLRSSIADGLAGLRSSVAHSFAGLFSSVGGSSARVGCSFLGSIGGGGCSFFTSGRCFLAANEGERTHQGSQSRQKEELVGLHSLFSSLLCLFRRGRRERRP